MRKCENKAADQLAQLNSAFLISKISSLYFSSVTEQLGLCQTWSETPKTYFITSRLKCSKSCVDSNVHCAHVVTDRLATRITNTLRKK